MRTHGIIERYRRYLPVGDDARIITLAEGSTPLIQAPALSEAVHPRLDIWLKCEGMNPTGSFKDRGMTMAITKAVEDGHEAVICASTGNTSAAAAAYSARAGLKCVVLIPEGRIAEGKLSQAMIHGAKVVQIRGNFDEALKLAVAITKEHPFVLVNSLNPFRIEGQKTGAFEIMDDFQGTVPDFHVLPVGNAGNITAYWKGYKEYHAHGKVKRLPRMLGFQAAGAAPIVLGRQVENPKTFASAIRIGNPAGWKAALQARDESDGVIGMVTDRQIKNAYRKLASLEGIFCEPASAAGVAGLMKLSENGFFDSDLPIKAPKVRAVCVLTGHGLKDTQNAIKAAEEPVTIDASVDAILEVIGQQTAPAAV